MRNKFIHIQQYVITFLFQGTNTTYNVKIKKQAKNIYIIEFEVVQQFKLRHLPMCLFNLVLLFVLRKLNFTSCFVEHINHPAPDFRIQLVESAIQCIYEAFIKILKLKYFVNLFEQRVEYKVQIFRNNFLEVQTVAAEWSRTI